MIHYILPVIGAFAMSTICGFILSQYCSISAKKRNYTIYPTKERYINV